ncbi:type I polyketide synthase [Methylosinus sp. R-45379]|uniref:type I polyketide synthase n=1 Tax=Methylosinus sp. R-45379 TaxID=980563 RepID=UPI000AE9A47B|nr:type I polyketide synthase [Methylosinus sp. R-45379]
MSEADFKKKALLAIETLRARVRELEDARAEPIAIIGYAARLPGARDAEAFWRLLSEGRDGIAPIPADRWDADAFYDPDPDAAGKVTTRRAGFADDVANFDAQFFGVSPREAEFLDPQHRLMLETSWHAIEHAGIAPADLEGSRTGMFVGLSTHDYLTLLSGKLGYAVIEAYFGTGTSPAACAGRVSFRFGFEGPAVTIDTACSSSLVTLHEAAQALRAGECELALAGGVNVIYNVGTMINFSRARMLAPDGKCKTFDAAADGYVRGEGCGILVLKRLSGALRDGDTIRALIRGSAVNQDGASGGLTVPNGRAQQRVIREAMKQANLVAGEIDFLEAHGTGTSLGDPIEAQAAAAALGAGRPADRPLLIGSAKTNIGHLEAAAGVAGVLKVVLSLEHELLPKHLNFRTPSPHIPWKQLPLKVVSEPREWPRSERARRAGVSSFGFSGTNAHVILEEAPAPAAPQQETARIPERPWRLLPLSARNAAALKALAQAYAERIEALPSVAAFADICYTAGVGRSHLEHRAAIVAEDPASAARLLTALAEERPSPGVHTGVSADPPKTAWLFTGQGGQYAGMGRELYETQPIFRDTLDECAAAIKDILPRPLLEAMFAEDGAINHTSYAQPALFALEMGLARLWRSWGVSPDVVVGHSVGQYAAACVAGAFSLEQGARLLAERGRLFGALPAGGSMAAIFAEAGAVEARLSAYPHVSVAAYNGAHIVISGPQADVLAVAEQFRGEGKRAEALETSHAFHSELLEPALDAFEAFAEKIPFENLTRTLVCNRTGKALGAQTRLDAQYWRRHSRQPVQFAQSVQTLASLGCRVVLEIGPQPVLAAMALRAWPEATPAPQPVASLRRDSSDARQIEEALGQLYVAGARIDFKAVEAPWKRNKIDLPLYPFQRKRFWFKQTRAPAQDKKSADSQILQMIEDGQLEELGGRLRLADDKGATQRVLQALYDHYQRERFSQNTAENLYELAWSKRAGRDFAPQASAHSWLVAACSEASARPLMDELTNAGHAARFVDLAAAADFPRLVAAALPTRVAILTAIDAPEGFGETSLKRFEQMVMAGACGLSQALAASGAKTPVFLVTSGAQPVAESDAIDPTQGCAFGFGKVLALEHPDLWGGLVDLPAAEASAADWRACANILRAETRENEDQFAIRGGQTFIVRLRRRTIAAARPLDIGTEKTYLVTGGLGALGLEAAAYLAGQGARHIALTSRRTPDDRAHQRLEALRERYEGCELRVIPGDVSSEADVARILERIGETMPPLAGVIHTAGEIDATRLTALEQKHIEKVFAGKVWGAYRLTRALEGASLDFFISFSSIASVWGSFGQTAYAAANGFLDSLAAWQRRQGMPGASVNFGPWSAGMADEAAREQLAKRGVLELSSELALNGMKAVLESADGRGVVARVDWARFLPVFQLQARRAFMKELEKETPEGEEQIIGGGALAQRLLLAPAEGRKRMLLDHMRQVLAEVVRLDPAQIREEAGFFDLGMDSLMAIELRKRLEKDLGETLPATMAIDHPRLTDAADFLLSRIGLQNEAQAEAAPIVQTLRADEPIAIVGLACRLPGAGGADAYWDLLSHGVDAIREAPSERFDIDELYDPDPEAAGKVYTRNGGYMEGVDLFDSELFGVSPREALWMEPQQRLVLETAWEALEDAGLGPAGLSRSRTGVFVGVGANEYSHLLAGSPEEIQAYFITGNALNVIAGRVAFSLGLEGPAMAIDTACSSSLVALHEGAQALRAGECDMSLAAGVNVLLSPATMIAACRARMLSPDGRCKTFDASADGYARGEGVGVLVLKRLSDAQRDGDRIRAVLRGSAVNQDGASSGLTVPNGRAQQRVIRAALDQAGLAPADVDYIEAHGTGTSLGDPIEAQAAAAALGAGRPADRPLLIGSAKTNIGHLEAAAGVAGVIKVVLSLEHGLLPKHLHFKTPSPHIPWKELPLKIVSEARPWPRSDRKRRAGVSSFGFSGTNAHVILEEAPAPVVAPAGENAAPAERLWHLLPLSARSAPALQALAQAYVARVEALPSVAAFADVCHTAGVARSHLEHRAAIVAQDGADAARLLAALAEGRPAPGLHSGVSADPPKTAWLFTGQGSQYSGMGRELYETQPLFKETLDQCAAAIGDILPRPLLEVMFGEDGAINHTSYAQPALFALEMGLARLWRSWGMTPDVVLGHSVGQYAAACVAGAFSLEQGARLLAERGRLFGDLPAGGSMAAVFAEAGVVEARLSSYPRVSVAAYNGANIVISGPQADVRALVEAFRGEGRRTEELETSHAFHSELLEPALDAFEAFAGETPFETLTHTLICNRTGRALDAQTRLDAQYWRRHSRQPVQFAQSVQTLADLGCRVLVEIGPQPVLAAMSLRAWPEGRQAPQAVASLRRDSSDARQIEEALGQLYVAGARPDFAAIDAPWKRSKVDIPKYPFQRKKYWPRAIVARGGGAAGAGALLGSLCDLPSGDTLYATCFSVKHLPWLEDHVIYGAMVVPGATYASMALAAVGAPAQLREVFFYEPIVFTGEEQRDVQLTLRASEDAAPSLRKFEVHSRPRNDRDASWSLNASGSVELETAVTDEAPEAIDTIIGRLSPMPPQRLFDGFAENELRWGPNWSGSLRALWAEGPEAVGELQAGEELSEHISSEPIHPVLLDLCTGVAGAVLLAAAPEAAADDGSLFLPLRYERVTLREKMPRRFYCHARWRADADERSETQSFDLVFVDGEGRYLGGIDDFVVKRAPRQALLRGLGVDAGRLLHLLSWRERPLVAAPAAEAAPSEIALIVAAPDHPRLPTLRAALAERGRRIVTVAPAAAYERRDDGFTLDPRDAEHWRRAFLALAEAGESAFALVFLASGNAGPIEAEPSDALLARLTNDLDGIIGATRYLVGPGATAPARGLWLVTERAVAADPSEAVDPAQSAIWGLGRTILAEQSDAHCALVDTDGSAEAIQSLADALLSGAPEPEFALRRKKCMAPRLMPWARSGLLAAPTQDYRLQPSERGAIDNLRLAPESFAPPGPGHVQLRSLAGGLNFRDVLNVLGLYPGDPGEIGGELAGVVTAVGEGVEGFAVGDRVFGFAPGGAFATAVNTPYPFLAHQPASVGAAEAATLPAAMLTVMLGYEWALPKKGERVLIHAASGGVGLAAVQLAQKAGAIVYATASAPKQQTLRDLGVEYIYDSRTLDFADQILADTGGAGVDIVLNSLTSEGFVAATVRATAQGGRFIEIAKRDIWTPEAMAAARPDIAYHILALDDVMRDDLPRIKRMLDKLAEDLGRGELQTLPFMAYPITEAKTAFRCMQQARHIGKIVLTVPEAPKPRRDRSYLVTGGLGALGLRMAEFLAQQGAGRLVLTSRRPPDDSAKETIAAIMSQYDCRVDAITADVGDEASLRALLEGIRRDGPPLGGVFHLAGVLDDALIPQQTPEKVLKTLAPKALGAWLLHHLTLDDAPELFVMFSSASAVLGSPGQANYAAANAFLDGLAAHRHALGLPAASVNYGPWAEAGMAASEAARVNLGRQGLTPLKPAMALSALAEMIRHGAAQAIVIGAQWQRIAKLMGPTRPPMLEHVLPKAAAAQAFDGAFLKQLEKVPEEQRADFLTEHLQGQLQHILGLAQPPAPDSRFLELGMDSLMAVELRNRLLGQFGASVSIPSTVVFDHPTVRALAEYLGSQTAEGGAVEATTTDSEARTDTPAKSEKELAAPPS